MEKQKQLLLKYFIEKLRKGESLGALSLSEIFEQANKELSVAEKTFASIKETMWLCEKCTKSFDYCWCNPTVH